MPIRIQEKNRIIDIPVYKKSVMDSSLKIQKNPIDIKKEKPIEKNVSAIEDIISKIKSQLA